MFLPLAAKEHADMVKSTTRGVRGVRERECRGKTVRGEGGMSYFCRFCSSPLSHKGFPFAFTFKGAFRKRLKSFPIALSKAKKFSLSFYKSVTKRFQQKRKNQKIKTGGFFINIII